MCSHLLAFICYFFFPVWNVLSILSPSGEFLLLFQILNSEQFLSDTPPRAPSLAKVPLPWPLPHCAIRAQATVYHNCLGLCIPIRLSVLQEQEHVSCGDIVLPVPSTVLDGWQVLNKYLLNEQMSLKGNDESALFATQVQMPHSHLQFLPH